MRRASSELYTGGFGRFFTLATSGHLMRSHQQQLRALLLQAFYTIRSERQLMEQLHYNLLYRWFVGLGVDDPVWVPTVFTKNRDRLLKAEVARKFLAELLTHKEVRALLSDEHFSVDGTQVQAWASMKSFVAKDGSSEPPSSGRNGERDFHGEKRRNDTHASTTEPEAKLYKKGKGKEAKLSYIGNVMTENRNGFVVEAELRPVSGSVEREAAAAMIVRHSPGAQRITLGADKGFDTGRSPRRDPRGRFRGPRARTGRGYPPRQQREFLARRGTGGWLIPSRSNRVANELWRCCPFSDRSKTAASVHHSGGLRCHGSTMFEGMATSFCLPSFLSWRFSACRK